MRSAYLRHANRPQVNPEPAKHLFNCDRRSPVPLQARTIPLQIIYLVLALIALAALLEIFSGWQL
jgi:hypothetical protein